MNIFEQASILKLRFPSSKGELTTEQLWELPLQSKSQFDLDNVAKAVNGQLRAVTEESFVSTATNPAKDTLQTKLEIVKHIIAAKITENTALRNAAARKAEREKLVGILADKQDEQLKALTPDAIRARIAELEKDGQ